MQHDKVGSLMTMDVVRTLYSTPVDEAARLLAGARIGGLPVVDEDDRVIGVLSAADLTAPRAAPPDPCRSRRFLGLPAAPSAARRSTTPETAARTAGQLMSAPPVTAHAEDTIIEAARIMARRGVNRLPVLDEEDRLVGILTRRDLLRVFLRSDACIRDEVTDEVLVRVLWLMPHSIDVTVADGVVTLSGRLERRSEAEIAVAMTRQIDGVVAVVGELTWRLDETRQRSDEQVLHGVADDRLRKL
ncbi:CBS domain-containing protein [Streptomyces sp. FXY-T5]|uniref:CBS domain-containing protein n=1 Tax=Streptomyces sp. FXY-T5 TaxID=3064901 RepID=UPI0027D28141|nr:CBS domain-containing protein [Streptomyces sp. FXY-T5]WMD06756.1 CBS domain-containing protein [Streptomyces sp. FXY-T5]